ncbi:RraA family protein [Ulvibacterium sp.]|uniref:RraA family protein n=1 Tax=Ulvibacterium sp. TaxID=2665914 RepID=UPI00260C4256|nr:RraA family protein [Ulvibacterium sp.]
MIWQDDDELFQLIKSELFSAVVGDVMDKLGYFHQFLSPKIVPLQDNMVVVGRAMPVLEADSFGEISPSQKNPIMSKPFGLMLEALDDLQKNEVYICTGSSPEYALWGELMSARALQCGAVGAVVDGYSRDTSGILELGFPTFSYGRYAQDQGPRGKVIDYRVPIEMNGVWINPGDIIFGDRDGVCVIPRKIEKDVMEAALEKARGEKVVLKAIQNGMSATEAFAKYGIM